MTILKQLASQVKARRLEQELTQEEMATRAGMGHRTYQIFESTGQTSLKNLYWILSVLGEERRLLDLVPEKKRFQSLEEFKQSGSAKVRQRVRKKRS